MGSELEKFRPINEGVAKLYSCGPSIYLLPHIGNYRSFLYEDILQRYLEHLDYKVERVLNVTDVEDKAIAQAQKEGVSLAALTSRNFEVFVKELRMLNARIPDFIPRSSTSVDQVVVLIERLIERGYAYWHEGDVYYDPLKFPDFGKLYGLDMSSWPKTKRRFRKDTYPGNRWNRGDFILWKGYRDGETVYWDTNIGKGRPAWNVQDPAMAMKFLGPEVDIACGGVDNLIRHHDYIMAVAEGATGKRFARYWLHGAHLYVNGKKMSKSRGNIIYPTDIVEQGYEWRDVRFFLIYGHYRKRLHFTWLKFKKSIGKLHQLREMVQELNQGSFAKSSSPLAQRIVSRLKEDFERNLDNDLHVRDAFDALLTHVSRLKALKARGSVGAKEIETALHHLREIDMVLQVIF
ncbi:MAG TPA: class I tRNA ligase family protein [Candidatus Bathyarchaeia archaeon]|nr:class I tRNA ligase family protein [Candidatus Bathyarchaeia archaeon]